MLRVFDVGIYRYHTYTYTYTFTYTHTHTHSEYTYMLEFYCVNDTGYAIHHSTHPNHPPYLLFSAQYFLISRTFRTLPHNTCQLLLAPQTIDKALTVHLPSRVVASLATCACPRLATTLFTSSSPAWHHTDILEVTGLKANRQRWLSW